MNPKWKPASHVKWPIFSDFKLPPNTPESITFTSESQVSPLWCYSSSLPWLDSLEDKLLPRTRSFDHPIKANQLGQDSVKSYLLLGYDL